MHIRVRLKLKPIQDTPRHRVRAYDTSSLRSSSSSLDNSSSIGVSRQKTALIGIGSPLADISQRSVPKTFALTDNSLDEDDLRSELTVDDESIITASGGCTFSVSKHQAKKWVTLLACLSVYSDLAFSLTKVFRPARQDGVQHTVHLDVQATRIYREIGQE
jgi:hypothetical protein